MEHYLIQLSYTALAWQQQIDRTTDADQRFTAVRKLIARLGGSFARYHFFDGGEPPTEDVPPFVVADKFVGIGEDDVIAIVALPSSLAARAFSMAIAAEGGVKSVRLTPLLGIPQAVQAMGMAKDAIAMAGYSAPGGAATSWEGATPTTAARSGERGVETTPHPERPLGRRGSRPRS
ncbi:hypothetical protein GXW78_25560 [Roseomonas terrae]|uniref:GYD domain-containing protein n=1 Tax=Neoroseomonas terrae TaxID=424799 RepID=A0ABS5EPV0_9PROT|nr:hypothetical protein [Neoroseomonas terrae]MBR0653049.1 hypothetical protein [Neoroseomonas terrae]